MVVVTSRTVTADHRRRVVRDINGVRVVLLLLRVMMLLMQQLVVMATTAAVTVAAAAAAASAAADKNVLHTPTGSDRRDAAVVIFEARIIVVQREIGTMQLLMVL